MIMKKTFISLIILLAFIFSGSVFAGDFKLGLEVGYFYQGDEDFRDLYGSGGLTFGVNADYMITNNIEIAAAFDFYSANGNTAITEELIEINLNHLRFGANYIFILDGWRPKVGAGLDIAFVSENTPFGDFSDSGFGAYILAGADFDLSEKITASVELIYSFVSIEGDLDDEGVGGLSALAALKFNL